MNIDVVNFNETQFASLTYEQRKILYEAQAQKNEWTKELAKEKENAKLVLIANGTARSDLLQLLYDELQGEYNKKVRDLAEVTLDAVINGIPNGSSELSAATYTVSAAAYTVEDGVAAEIYPLKEKIKTYDPESPDETLLMEERYLAVKAFYEEIESIEERYEAFCKDEKARTYLGEYYETLKNEWETV